VGRFGAWLPFLKTEPQVSGRRSALFVSLSQCATASSLTFVELLLPFYVFKVSPYSEGETLLWTGAIIGVTGLCLTVTSLFWGSLAHRFSPKKLYQQGQAANVILFFSMGFTTDLSVLLVLRLLQGVFGGVSTIGLILVSSHSTEKSVAANIGLFQSFLTLGQLMGPPLGSLAAATFGYRGAFLCGSAIALTSVVVSQFKVVDIEKLPVPAKSGRRFALDRRMLIGWLLCFMVQIQLTFLPSILPKVLGAFNVHGPLALKLAGIVVVCYTAATVLGTFVWTRLVRKIGIIRLIIFLASMGVLFQGLLSFTRGVPDFAIVRMLQTGCTAAVLPLVITIFAAQRRGTVIGFLNSSRHSGHAVGPMLATTMLAASNLHALSFLISGVTLLSLAAFGFVFARGEGADRDSSGRSFP